jgi:signal transduction histidine kinase
MRKLFTRKQTQTKTTSGPARGSLFRSLKVRIFALILLFGMVPALILSESLLGYYRDRVIAVRTSEAQTQLRVLANHLITYGYLDNPDNDIVSAELSQYSSFYDGRVLVINDALQVVDDTYNVSRGKTIVSGDVVKCLRQGSAASTSHYDEKDGYIEIVIPIAETASLEGQDTTGNAAKDGETIYGVLLSSVSTASIEAMHDALGQREMILALILLLVIIFLAVVFSYLLVKPFDRLTRKISDVREGYSSDPIEENAYTETAHIMTAFNQVLGRMRALDDSRQDFVSNVSHELKTPMTSMKVLADSLLSDPNTPPEMYREFLTDIDSELDRENKMIAELLNLAKMDRKQVTMNISTVDIGSLLEIVMKRVRPLAQKRDIELTLVQERDVSAEVDEVKMTMVFTNLIENAVKYNKDHGKVTVALNADHKNFTVTVEDTGVGIPEDSVARVFERFYRVDKSRSREVGGTGLGLSIVKSAVLLHKGSITVDSVYGEGTRFTVVIPLIYIQTKDATTAKALVVKREEGGSDEKN